MLRTLIPILRPPFMAAAMLMCLVLPVRAASPPSWEDGADGKGQQNTRSWRPGEPLDWIRKGLLDSLHSQGFSSFTIIVESPKEKGYRKTVRYTREGDREAIYVEGDLRFISYDIPSRINASQSVVVGYSYFSVPYWYNGELCFQNGQSNWYRHAHRHYHSLANGQIEMRQASTAPEGAENAIVFADDSASYFLVFSGKLEESSTPALVYALPHRSMEWEFKGRLHPNISRLYSAGQAQSLKDYWVIFYSGSATLIRKRDLAITQVSSSLALHRKGWHNDASSDNEIWGAARGNEMRFNWNGTTVIENFDETVAGAQWKPLFVPFDLPGRAPSRKAQPILPYVVALLLGGFVGAFLLREMRTSRRRKWTSDAVPEEPSQPTLMLQMLMSRRGQLLSTQALDQLFELHQVASSETRRSRRSRIIQMINMESMARFGEAIIHRERSELDKRVMNYRIELNEAEETA